MRNKLFDVGILRSVEFDFPVISVGNITVGGTGKTPHVEYLLRLLSGNYSIALLSRGYKRKTKGFVLAQQSIGPDEIGDESYQVWKKFEKIKVAVDAKRVHGIRILKKIDSSIKCIILDDAYQHRYVNAGLSILLVDYYRPLNKDRMLPLGNLRENARGIRRANIVIVTKVPHEIKPIEMRQWIKELKLFPYQYLYFTSFRYGDLKPVFNIERESIALGEIEKRKPGVLLITGIANPEPLYNKLVTYCTSIDHVFFPDHHDYTMSDIHEIETRFNAIPVENKLIITTEKDAVKISNLPIQGSSIKDFFYFIPVEVLFLDHKQEEFDRIIFEYVERNKRICRISG